MPVGDPVKGHAALRADTIAATIQPNVQAPGQYEPECANDPHIIPIIAKGRANTECSTLIISR